MSLIIVLVTLGISVWAFSSPDLMEKLSLKPSRVVHQKEYQRILTHAFVHADYVHLLVNMYVLWVFGSVCEKYFSYFFGNRAGFHFLSLYVLSLLVSSLYSIYKHRNNTYYTAVGASGAVMAVVFTSIFFDPWNKLYFFGVLPIPGIIFGGLYLVYSVYMGRKGNDNIGHDAHFTGAVFGFIYPVLVKPYLFTEFLYRLLHP